ncbi:hypothetical protein L1987_42607 [Smallanthus sonchifolius]|uniref:Uncharacterized protein n=1 Tax=Smallanthus sonchifolius TaxID=185202 RepID=A0ACB9GK27_9ASTR|nr:hypothetical protein L1987_42607 [Smallanthus sonchifolius]
MRSLIAVLACLFFHSFHASIDLLSLSRGETNDDHEEADEESFKKAKFFLGTTVQNWDVGFYLKVDKDIHLDLGKCRYLSEMHIVGKQWYEHEWWKFGDETESTDPGILASDDKVLKEKLEQEVLNSE